MKQKVLVIVGPTASGKSALGVRLAKKFKGEVISADSRQVYRGLDIGTGKITRREMKGVPHHLLDVASPKRNFSAGEYVRTTEKIIPSIWNEKKLPIIVGGTGFYIDALLGRIDLPEVPPNPTLRAKLQKKTAAELYRELKKHDPARAKRMATPSERNNKVRLTRAIEIAKYMEYLGRSYVVHRTVLGTDRYDVLWIGINPPFELLEKKILKRLRERVRNGMLAEARRLHKTGLSYKRMEALGLEYRSLARLLQKKITPTEFERELYQDIRRYAKKQLGYWRRNKDIRWFDTSRAASIEEIVRTFLR